MARAARTVSSKLPQTVGMEFGWKVTRMLEKSESSAPNITSKKSNAAKYNRLDEDIRILQADTGNSTTVLGESECKNETDIFLNSGVYEPPSRDPTARIERRIQKRL
jgi:hypothetical protein